MPKGLSFVFFLVVSVCPVCGGVKFVPSDSQLKSSLFPAGNMVITRYYPSENREDPFEGWEYRKSKQKGMCKAFRFDFETGESSFVKVMPINEIRPGIKVSHQIVEHPGGKLLVVRSPENKVICGWFEYSPVQSQITREFSGSTFSMLSVKLLPRDMVEAIMAKEAVLFPVKDLVIVRYYRSKDSESPYPFEVWEFTASDQKEMCRGYQYDLEAGDTWPGRLMPISEIRPGLETTRKTMQLKDGKVTLVYSKEGEVICGWGEDPIISSQPDSKDKGITVSLPRPLLLPRKNLEGVLKQLKEMEIYNQRLEIAKIISLLLIMALIAALIGIIWRKPLTSADEEIMKQQW
jgi:hypothetical protein